MILASLPLLSNDFSCVVHPLSWLGSAWGLTSFIAHALKGTAFMLVKLVSMGQHLIVLLLANRLCEASLLSQHETC